MAKTKLMMLIDLSTKTFNKGLGAMQSKWSQTIGVMDAKFGHFINKVPMLGGMLERLKTPITALAIAGIGLFSAFAVKGVDAAKRMDAAFLPIRNLNLEKPREELDQYKNKIRDAAFEIGTNLEDSINAVHDLQSATGMFGDDAIEVFKKVGVYSFATGAELSDAMNATTKAMKAFGYGIEDIDALLESNAKAVKMGITTFDELAKVQTVFAGNASSAGQTVDTANKVFAVFTSIGKGSDIAAMKTKAFFQGLGAQSDNIKKYLNVDVFDADGMARQADVILEEIAGKFQHMSNKEVTEIINQIGGPDGLRDGLAKAASAAEDMMSTFESFDSQTFSMKEAMENAEGDVSKMTEEWQNRMEILSSKFGEKFFPLIAGIFDKLNPALEWLYENFDTVAIVLGSVAGAFAIVTAATWAWNIALAANPVSAIIIAVVALIALVYQAIKHFDSWGAAVLFLMGPFGMIISTIKSLYDHWESVKKAFETDGIVGGLKRLGQVLLDAVLKPIQQLLEILAKLPDKLGGNMFKDAAESVKRFRGTMDTITPGEKEAEKKKAEGKDSPTSLYDSNATLGGGTDLTGLGASPTEKDKLKKDVNKVTGDAKQTKNITINIDALNKGGINMNGSTNGMSIQEVEEWFNNMMMRIMRNAELS